MSRLLVRHPVPYPVCGQDEEVDVVHGLDDGDLGAGGHHLLGGAQRRALLVIEIEIGLCIVQFPEKKSKKGKIEIAFSFIATYCN